MSKNNTDFSKFQELEKILEKNIADIPGLKNAKLCLGNYKKNNTIKPDGFYWSASRHGLFNQCQKCFWLKYILKVPVGNTDDSMYEYGRFVHENLENIQNGEKEKDPKELLEIGLKEIHVRSAKFHIEEYKKYAKKLDLTNGVPEVEFSMDTGIKNPLSPKESLFLYGFIDYLEFTKDTIKKPRSVKISGEKIEAFDENSELIETPWRVQKMLEFKTSTASFSQNKIQSTPQFLYYWQVLQNMPKAENATMHLLNFRKETPKMSARVQVEIMKFSPEKIKDIFKEVENISENIQNKNISPISTCPYKGEYQEICPDFSI